MNRTVQVEMDFLDCIVRENHAIANLKVWFSGFRFSCGLHTPSAELYCRLEIRRKKSFMCGLTESRLKLLQSNWSS